MKNVIFFGLGAIAGAVVTVLCVKGHYQKLADDEIQEIRDVYRKKIASKEIADKNSAAKKALLEEKFTEKEPENEAKLTQLTQKKDDIQRFEELREPYIQSHNVFSNPLSNDDMSDLEEYPNEDPYEFVVDRTGPSEVNSEPFLISEEEFAGEKLFYDKVMLFYYTDGIAVLEDTDEIVESIEELIGPDILPSIFDMGTKFESDTAYVRNDNRSTDYGIIFTGTEFVQEEAPG